MIIFLILTVIFGFFGETFSKIVISLYVLCVLTVASLGYFGGELVYGTKTPALSVSQGPAAEGVVVFQQNCSACHLTDSTATKIGPGLKGLFKNPRLPDSGEPTSERAVRERIVSGGKKIPPFKHLKEEQMQALIDFLKSL